MTVFLFAFIDPTHDYFTSSRVIHRYELDINYSKERICGVVNTAIFSSLIPNASPWVTRLKSRLSQGCESGSGGSASAKTPPLPLPRRREEWREKRNCFCYPS